MIWEICTKDLAGACLSYFREGLAMDSSVVFYQRAGLSISGERKEKREWS